MQSVLKSLNFSDHAQTVFTIMSWASIPVSTEH